MGRLEGKVAVVMGASGKGSMGQATARRFVEEGAKVVIAARRLEPLEALAAEIGATAVACDIASDEQIQALAKAAADKYGRVDIAVNFAGINVQSPIADIDASKLKDAIDIQFTGAILFIKHMAAAMPESGGSIIMTSSLTATLHPQGMTAYAATKAGVDHAVIIAANEYGKQNIRVNAITPGFIPTEMTNGIIAAAPVVPKAFLRETRLPRLGSVDDIANAALWLASDEAFVTGINLQISGGAQLGKFPSAEDFGR
ncbi:SDR family oxidoreductase [Emcibacter sp. SYSU 3D8]|uniref:SDR family NAD(P)-dependent oxidoreductase n=1 Tax=Emcibacter sp. SYSU 3D8 TaxID=3133969 RepID=UPI0031FF0AA4